MTEVVEITAGTGVVEIVDASPADVIDVATAGPVGPRGPAGPAGPTGARGEGNAYVHTQTTPATVWTITHALGYDPGGVLVVDVDGYAIDGFGIQILQPGVSLRLSYDIPLAGVAYLS